MRLLIITLLLCATCAVDAAQSNYEGYWFQCMADWQTRDNFMLLEVRKKGTDWMAEWGVENSAGGEGKLDQQGNLVLRGCSGYRGVVSEECDVQNPPIFLVLSRNLLKKPVPATDSALRKGLWIRTNGRSWEKLAKRCSMLDKNNE